MIETTIEQIATNKTTRWELYRNQTQYLKAQTGYDTITTA